MAKEPTRGNSQGYLKEFFLANPTVVLSLLYLYVTAIGMLYSAVLYGRFGINVFDYSEIGDFLLAAFKNPVAFLSGGLLAAMGGALLSYRAAAVRRRERGVEEEIARMRAEEMARLRATRQMEEEMEEEVRKIRQEVEEEVIQMRRALERRRTAIYAIVIAVTSVFSSFVLPYYSAGKTASSIKAGETPSVDVRYRSFKGSAGQVTVPSLGLIGATEKAAFFYDVDHKRTIVIPQAQLVSIEVPE
jgi:hypothetical protein